MKRFFWYKLGFFITVLLYSFLKILKFEFADTLATILYFLSSLAFVFTAETLPTEHLNIPAVHYYYKSRMNYYGLMVSIILVFSSIVFAIVLINTQIPVGIVCLIFWFIMVFAVYLYSFFKFDEKLEMNMVVDYVTRTVNEEVKRKKLNIEYRNIEIRKIVKVFIQKNVTTNSELKKLHSQLDFKSMSYNDLEEIFNIYQRYLSSFKEELVSDEVRAL